MKNGEALLVFTEQRRPVQEDELIHKFRGLAAPVLGETEADELQRLVLSLDTLPNIAAISRLLQKEI